MAPSSCRQIPEDTDHVKKKNKSKLKYHFLPRVLGLFGQRVRAQRNSGIMDFIFPENVGLHSYFKSLKLELKWAIAQEGLVESVGIRLIPSLLTAKTGFVFHVKYRTNEWMTSCWSSIVMQATNRRKCFIPLSQRLSKRPPAVRKAEGLRYAIVSHTQRNKTRSICAPGTRSKCRQSRQ